ncbi:mitogen-activated protein kinase kinase kinase 1 isoform X2 [Populus trichocarpa]|uniref:mitogen-activated protein kinase kinase kinase 1 isoform X2 n=1 Tax=Populus trichocarpa TaxID=3694 RepID=UPI002278AF56|nr:mitogen-activated protein kinase kinase kinase 1 isoform X2 [Populus trichocarpa]
MQHLSQFLTRKKKTSSMDPKNRRRPRLERRNALRHVAYDATSSSSSLDDSSSSLLSQSLDLPDRTSFRIEGTEGEFDRIFRSLGLSGPEDFSIPEAAWEAMKVRSASDILPRSRLFGSDSPKAAEEAKVVVEGTKSELHARVLNSVRVRDSSTQSTQNEPAELNKFRDADNRCLPVGIKGLRPPLLKPPPSMTLPVIDKECSTWDLFRDFAPENDRVVNNNIESTYDDGEEEKEERREQVINADADNKREEEENLLRIGETVVLSESCSFSTSNDDDSSSSTTEPMSNISPNVRFRRAITYWEKGELLGRGSFGSVYEGISDDGFFFAVKEVSLLDQGSKGKQSIYQLEQEIALLSRFEHENIVQYYGTDKDESKLYIFLELVTKGSLQKLYQRYNLRDSQVSSYTRQILHGLKYLHDQNVVHRDIKCANLLVDANGSVKLADFGLAKATKLNDVKSCKGTAFWMAPEVVNNKNQGYGLPADIWSLGCTVLEMLTRQIPYSELESVSAIFDTSLYPIIIMLSHERF